MSAIKTYMPNTDARVEAMLFRQETDSVDLAVRWANGPVHNLIFDDGWQVKTLEGWVDLPYGHYLIKGTNGEFYPCDPDVFEKRWQLVCPDTGGSE